MPRSGDVYGLPAGYLAVDGVIASASQHNTPLEDLAADQNAARPVSAGGTGATTATDARANLGVLALSATTTFTRSLLDDETAAEARATLGISQPEILATARRRALAIAANT